MKIRKNTYINKDKQRQTMANKLQRGKIYAIRSHQTDDIYIGSTCQSLSMRMGEHRRHLKSYNLKKVDYITSFDILKFDDAYIELIENYPCKTRDELHRREGEIIREKDCVNKNIPGRTLNEWREDNKEKIRERCKKYKESNVEKIREQCKKYKESNVEKIKQYQQNNIEKIKATQKQYQQNNAAKIKATQKQYYQDNAEKIKEKIECECGIVVNKKNLTNHRKTKKHIYDFIHS